MACFLLLFAPVLAAGQDDPLSWVNSARRAAGASPVVSDGVLSETASRWASILAEAGVLSHRGADGSSVLDRYRALGGMEVHVGEILGAGPSLSAVEKGWMGSTDHRRLALNGAWTHVGWGSAPARTSQVWVMVFCQRLVDGLSILADDEGLSVTGRFSIEAALAGVFFSGLDSIEASEWDARARSFTFRVPGSSPAGYFRLGFRTVGGGLVWTNAFTLPPEKGFPAGPARSSAPEPRP